MRDKNYSDLQELKEQADCSNSLAAHRAYINGLEYHLKESRTLNIRLRGGIEAALCAYDLASKEMKTDDMLMEMGKATANRERVVREEYDKALREAIKELARQRISGCADSFIAIIDDAEIGGYDERMYTDREKEAFGIPIMKAGEVDWDEVGKPEVDQEITESMWKAMRDYIEGATDPLLHDFAVAITWLKKRADDERSRIILLDERLDHIKEQLSGGDMK